MDDLFERTKIYNVRKRPLEREENYLGDLMANYEKHIRRCVEARCAFVYFGLEQDLHCGVPSSH